MRNKDCITPSYRGDSAPFINNNENREKKTELRHTIRYESVLNGVRSVNVTTDNRFLIITYEKSIPRIRIVDLEKLEFLTNNYEGHTDSVRMTRITMDNKAFYGDKYLDYKKKIYDNVQNFRTLINDSSEKIIKDETKLLNVYLYSLCLIIISLVFLIKQDVVPIKKKPIKKRKK